MSFTEDLLTGVASYLDSAGAGKWSPAAAHAANDTAITVAVIPQQPDKVISLTEYPVEDDPALSDAIVGLNVRLRGDTDPRTVIRSRDAVFDALHGLEHFVVGPPGAQVRLNLVWRQSSADLGPDANGRFERSENYYLRVNRPHPRLE